MSALPHGIRGIRFYSGRQMPKGAKFIVERLGNSGIYVVDGSVPGGPHVTAPCAVTEGEIVLDDNLFFEHEMGQKKLLR